MKKYKCCLLHPAGDDIILWYLSGVSNDESLISTNRKGPTFATDQNYVTMSLWRHKIETKKLPPPGEATHHTINISYLDNVQNLFTRIIACNIVIITI